MVSTVDQSDFVQLSLTMSPISVPYQNFGTPLIIGDSSVIDVGSRIRQYTTLLQVSADFGTTAPEYLAAQTFFSQQPTPGLAYVGRWARTATNGLLKGGILSSAQQAALLTTLQAISTGSFAVTLDGGSSHSYSALNFTSVLTLSGAAAVIQTALNAFAAGTTCTWVASQGQFVIASATTGAASSVSFASTTGSGTDISAPLLLQSSNGGNTVAGVAAETALASVTALAGVSNQWYCAGFAASTMPSDTDLEACAAYILASSRYRIFAVTTQNSAILNPSITTDIASVLQSLNNKRVFVQYSSSNPYAAFSLFGREATVNYGGSMTAITLAWKQEPGVAGENLTETQFAALIAKGGDVNINVDNGATMIWPGQMSNGYWCDEVQGLDWLANHVSTDLFNLMYETQTKVPQTDDGDQQIATEIESSFIDGVNNGLLAPGVWYASGFGSLHYGDTLTKGYYVYYPPIGTQSETARTTRVSVPFQCAVKLAGAVHTPNVAINVNR